MSLLRYTLVSEGSTDAALIPIINWAIRAAGRPLVEGHRAEFWRLQRPPGSLEEKLKTACQLFPCEVLFVHRDSDNRPAEERHQEVSAAINQAWETNIPVAAVAVIPVRMLEAWLLTNESAIRNAAGNPNGRVLLNLPQPSRLESRPDPKADLNVALREASELTGRRLKKFETSQAFWRVVDYMNDDFRALRSLAAFNRFEASVKRMAAADFHPGFY